MVINKWQDRSEAALVETMWNWQVFFAWGRGTYLKQGSVLGEEKKDFFF